MKLNIFLLIMLAFFIATTGIIFLQEEEVKTILLSSVANKLSSVSLLFISVFGILRFRDYLLNTSFPIKKINDDPKASAIYYSASVASFTIAIALIIS